METKRQYKGGRPRTKTDRNGTSGGHRMADWGRNTGPIHITRVLNEYDKPAIRIEDRTPGNERRRTLVMPVEHLPQLGFTLAETLQLDNPTEAWAQMRLAQLLATCDPDRVDAALALLMPTPRQVGELGEIFSVLDRSREVE